MANHQHHKRHDWTLWIDHDSQHVTRTQTQQLQLWVDVCHLQ